MNKPPPLTYLIEIIKNQQVKQEKDSVEHKAEKDAKEKKEIKTGRGR